MNSSYIAHDCTLEDAVTISGAMVGGTCTIGRSANLGLNVSVHQGSVIGCGAMVGMGAVITRHVAPFAKVYGSPARVKGANTVAMQRTRFSTDVIEKATIALMAGTITDLASLCPAEYARFVAAYAGSSRRA
jgi:UDP-N-acetylglucosamine acyltransferase